MRKKQKKGKGAAATEGPRSSYFETHPIGGLPVTATRGPRKPPHVPSGGVAGPAPRTSPRASGARPPLGQAHRMRAPSARLPGGRSHRSRLQTPCQGRTSASSPPAGRAPPALLLAQLPEGHALCQEMCLCRFRYRSDACDAFCFLWVMLALVKEVGHRPCPGESHLKFTT